MSHDDTETLKAYLWQRDIEISSLQKLQRWAWAEGFKAGVLAMKAEALNCVSVESGVCGCGETIMRRIKEAEITDERLVTKT